MKKQWHLLIPACALLFQPVPILFMRITANLTFGQSHGLPESWVWGVSQLGLAVCAAACLLLGGIGTYMLLRRSRMAVAIPLIILCCIPALLAGSVYLRAVLVFFTLI